MKRPFTPIPASKVPFGRVLTLLAGLCGLVLGLFGLIHVGIGFDYGHDLWTMWPQVLPLFAIVAAMLWIWLRLWRKGYGQPSIRVLAGLIAALAACGMVWAMLYDPGDAVFMVPVLAVFVAIFAPIASIGRG